MDWIETSSPVVVDSSFLSYLYFDITSLQSSISPSSPRLPLNTQPDQEWIQQYNSRMSDKEIAVIKAMFLSFWNSLFLWTLRKCPLNTFLRRPE